MVLRPPPLLLLAALSVATTSRDTGAAAGPASFRTRAGSVCRAPPEPSGIAGLNALVAHTAAAWQWLDKGRAHGFVGNFNQTVLIPLNWTFLNTVPVPHDAVHRPQQSHAFEPNENHKTAPILLDLARFPGGARTHAAAGLPYDQLGAVILRTYSAILDPTSPQFANFQQTGRTRPSWAIRYPPGTKTKTQATVSHPTAGSSIRRTWSPPTAGSTASSLPLLTSHRLASVPCAAWPARPGTSLQI